MESSHRETGRTSAGRALKVFISYSKADERYRKRLEVSLANLVDQGKIEILHDRKLFGGEDWESKLLSDVRTAEFILCLISPDFIATDFIREKEIPAALARHFQDAATVIPVLLKKTEWQGHPLATLVGFPTKLEPVVSDAWKEEDDAFVDIAQQLRRSVDEYWRVLAQGQRDIQWPEVVEVEHATPAVYLYSAPEDSWDRERLCVHLSPFETAGFIRLLNLESHSIDRTVAEKLQREIQSAHFIVLLLTANLLFNPEFKRAILPLLLDLHRRRVSFLVPVIVRRCYWEAIHLSDLPVILPENHVPLMSHPAPEDAFAEAAGVIVGLTQAIVYER